MSFPLKADGAKSMRIVIYQDASGEYRWHLRARNNKIVADSAESYKELRKCMAAVWKIFRPTLAETTQVLIK